MVWTAHFETNYSDTQGRGQCCPASFLIISSIIIVELVCAMQDMKDVLMDAEDQTFSQLEMVLDQFTALHHLMFGSVTTQLLYSVADKLPSLETLCATAVHDGNAGDHP